MANVVGKGFTVENIITFQNILKKFPGVVALDKVNFSIAKGEIHALVGENGAGKSTLMHILGGEFQQDEGEVILRGKVARIPNPHSARAMGIGIVYQELKQCPNLSVVENIFLGVSRKQGNRKLSWRELANQSKEMLDSLGADIDPGTLVMRLSIAERQLVEIARVTNLQADVLIMDEPNSALTAKETDRLFANLKTLQKKGVTIIFISHRLEEVFRISDRISVLRDGVYLGTFPTNETNIDDIVTLIAGKKLVSELSKKHSGKRNSGEQIVALEAQNLSRDNCFQDINFKLFKQEILGIYGLQGSGRTELLEAFFGFEKANSGQLLLFGKPFLAKNTADAISHGLAMVPEDRRLAGLFGNMDVKENICVSITDKLSWLSILRKKMVINVAWEFVNKLHIKVFSVDQMARNLSGGNQQKLIISRWLSTKPRILLVDEPTKGIDVGAKTEIYQLLRELRDEGLSILFVSSELPEVIAECDRVLVMRNGRMAADFAYDDITKENILTAAMKETTSTGDAEARRE